MADLKKLYGTMVRHHRKRRGLTQVALSERTGKSVETIARIERGEVGSRFEVVELMAAALKVRPSALFGVDPSGDVDGQFEDLVIELAKLSPDDVVWIRSVIDAALKGRRSS